MKRLILVIGVGYALGGCAAVDTSVDAVLPAVPEGWAALDEAAAAPPGAWLDRFGDGTLTSLVREALVRNTDLGQAAARLEQARASARVAGATRWPTLDAGPGATYTNVPVDTGTGVMRTDGTVLNLGLQTAWEVDVWGRLTDSTRAAVADADAAAADLAAAQLSTAGAVAQAWFGLIEAHLQTDLARRDLETKNGSLRLINRRYARGVSSSLDVRLARSERANRLSVLAQRRRQEAEAARSLEVLLGRYPSAELAAAADLPDLSALEGAGYPEDVLASRPDLQAAERRLAAAGLRVRAARKALLPRLTLSGTVDTSGPDFKDLIDPKTLAGNLIGGLLQPIFRGGALLAGIKIEKAQAEAALYDYAGRALAAFQEAEDALAGEARLAEQEAAQNVALKEAIEAEKLAERQYRQGVANIFNLLDAQTRRFSAESSYVSIRAARVNNRVRLYLALGAPYLANTAASPSAAGLAAHGSKGEGE